MYIDVMALDMMVLIVLFTIFVLVMYFRAREKDEFIVKELKNNQSTGNSFQIRLEHNAVFISPIEFLGIANKKEALIVPFEGFDAAEIENLSDTESKLFLKITGGPEFSFLMKAEDKTTFMPVLVKIKEREIELLKLECNELLLKLNSENEDEEQE